MQGTYASLVLELDVTEGVTELFVVGHGQQLRNLLEVDEPVL